MVVYVDILRIGGDVLLRTRKVVGYDGYVILHHVISSDNCVMCDCTDNPKVRKVVWILNIIGILFIIVYLMTM